MPIAQPSHTAGEGGIRCFVLALVNRVVKGNIPHHIRSDEFVDDNDQVRRPHILVQIQEFRAAAFVQGNPLRLCNLCNGVRNGFAEGIITASPRNALDLGRKVFLLNDLAEYCASELRPANAALADEKYLELFRIGLVVFDIARLSPERGIHCDAFHLDPVVLRLDASPQSPTFEEQTSGSTTARGMAQSPASIVPPCSHAPSGVWAIAPPRLLAKRSIQALR
mmetsp:Transcript_8099/g.20801  ORF Transcript_8099/g.20801 Transcript_8099/m.20801 type:complete len:223 (-) Transcript_8099:416-1084(-)